MQYRRLFNSSTITLGPTHAKKAVCQGHDVELLHNFGFFSNCSVALREIINYIHDNNSIPLRIESKNSFTEYKSENATLSEWFVNPENALSQILQKNIQQTQSNNDIFQHWFENDPYTFNVEAFQMLIHTYFKPNDEIEHLKNSLKSKYNIDPSNTLFLYLRGTDKAIEMSKTPEEIMIQKCKDLQNNLNIIVQSDEPTFIERVKNECINVIHIEELETRGHNDIIGRNRHSKVLLACTLIASECNTIIMTTGNVSLWMLLYRGHNTNVHQYYHPHHKEIGQFVNN
tara:strand:+ start:209 stop:1066 length:858 start_codon:yes stop_codon:yes gene_type:complete